MFYNNLFISIFKLNRMAGAAPMLRLTPVANNIRKLCKKCAIMLIGAPTS